MVYRRYNRYRNRKYSRRRVTYRKFKRYSKHRKGTVVKKSTVVFSFNPTNYTRTTFPNYALTSIDPPMANDTGALTWFNQTLASTSWYTNNGDARWTGWTNTPIIVGNKIKRIALSFRFKIELDLYSAPDNITAFTAISSYQAASANAAVALYKEDMVIRMVLFRCPHDIGDALSLAYAVTANTTTQFNRTFMIPVYEKIFKLDNNVKAEKYVKMKCRKLVGKQLIHLPINSGTGALAANQMTNNQLYLVFYIEGPSFNAGGGTVVNAYLPVISGSWRADYVDY